MTRAMPSQKSVLITGCSEGGIGFALAKEFQLRGLHVFATARSTAKMAGLEGLTDVTLLSLDVTSKSSIDAAVAAVSAATGGKLDYLVNNAGTQYVMPLLDADIQKAKDLYEVNVWGVVAMVQAFAPLVIASKGSIINIASIVGLMSTPWLTLYSGSKSAVQSISEILRLELKPFGVKVATVITGSVATNLNFKDTDHRLPEGSIYTLAQKEIAERALGTEEIPRGSCTDFARSLVGDVLNGAHGVVYHGKMSTLVWLLSRFVPTFLMDYIVSQNTGLNHLSH